MTLEERAHLHLMRETLNPHDIVVTYRMGQYVLSFVDKMSGLIRWACAGDLRAYKLGLDMRDNRSAYVEGKRRHDKPKTQFFQSNIDQLEAA